MIAIQLKSNGSLVDFFPNMESAKKLLDSNSSLEAIELHTNMPNIKVRYVELGGPNGYGEDIPEYTTYNHSKLECIKNLYKWVQSSLHTFGPDPSDIKNFFTHCYVHYQDSKDIDLTTIFHEYIDKLLTNKEIYV